MSKAEPGQAIVCGDRMVGEGECVHSIAGELGILPETLWSDPANARLKAARRNPGALMPGDALTVPTRPSKPAETNQTSVFAAGGVPRHPLSLRVLGNAPTTSVGDDPEDDMACCGHGASDGVAVAEAIDDVHGMPLADTSCRLVGDGIDLQGRTDGAGIVVFDVPITLREATIEVGEGDARFEMKLKIGSLRAIESREGVMQRLANMGLFFGDPAGEPDDVARLAIYNARWHLGLPAGFEPDEAMQAALMDIYGG